MHIFDILFCFEIKLKNKNEVYNVFAFKESQLAISVVTTLVCPSMMDELGL